MKRKRAVIGAIVVLTVALSLGWVLILPVYAPGDTLPAVRINAETGDAETTQLQFQGEWVTRRRNMEPPKFHGVISASTDQEEPGESMWTNFIAIDDRLFFGRTGLEGEGLTIYAAKDLQSFFCETTSLEGDKVGHYIIAPAQSLEEAEPIAATLGLGSKLP